MDTRRDDTAVSEWALDDSVYQLREWGRDHAYLLPQAPLGEWTLGSSRSCAVRLVDASQFVSREHARLVRTGTTTMLRDCASKNGLWIDGARRLSVELTAGLEIGIGSIRLVAESPRSILVRAFMLRLLGWDEALRPTIDRALRAIRSAATLTTPLVLVGGEGLPMVARYLHDRAFGDELPFVMADPERRRTSETARHAANYPSASEAIAAARGGTLCVWAGRPPADLEELRPQLADAGQRVRLIMCAAERHASVSAIRIPSLSERGNELGRVIDECAAEALAEHGSIERQLSDVDREWVLARAPTSYVEVAQSVERLVALRVLGTISTAASYLGMSHVAMTRWLDRREVPRNRRRSR